MRRDIAAGEGAPCPAGAVLDAGELRHRTFGDAALEREVLGLFAGQLRAAAEALERSDDTAVLLHTLKGSARAVGAFALAERLEERGGDLLPALRETLEAVFAHLGRGAPRPG